MPPMIPMGYSIVFPLFLDLSTRTLAPVRLIPAPVVFCSGWILEAQVIPVQGAVGLDDSALYLIAIGDVGEVAEEGDDVTV